MKNTQAKEDDRPSSQRSIRFDDDDEHSSRRSAAADGRPGARGGDDDDSASASTPTPSLHGNILRERKDRDPLESYEIVRMLGEGSIGSVCMVRKRSEAVGGSARPSNAINRRARGGGGRSDGGGCFDIPLLGGIFRHCLGGGGGMPSKVDKLCLVSNRDERESADGGSGSSSRPSVAARPGELERQDSSTTSASTVTMSRIVKHTGNYKAFYALKSLHLAKVANETLMNELRNEIELLKTLDHPHIVKAIETYEHRNLLFMVMELCSGGDLYSRDPYTEEDAARITYSILSAVAYLHSKDIIHRDLKYENIMFANTSLRSEVKLIDFGLSRRYGKEEILHEGVGTIYTMAPQVIMGDYDSQADIWSMGVIAFMLLSSMMPFYGKEMKEVVMKIRNCEYKFRGRRWKKVSKQAKNFVEELLQFDPEDRPTADEALQYVWFNKRFAATVRNPDEEVLNRIQATLETYAGYSKLKKLALMVVAHKSTSEEVGILRKVFKQYDIKGDGKISFPEFKQALSGFGYTDEKMVKWMFEGADLDGTGVISYTEFLAATIEAHGIIDEERLAEAFDRIDEDDSGYITAKNLRALLGQEVLQSEIDRIIAEADLLHDNRISYEEFLALWSEKEDIRREEALRQIERQRSSMDDSVRSLPEIPRSVEINKEDAVPTSSDDLTSEESLDFGVVQFSENKQLSIRKATEKKDTLFLPQ